MARSDFENLRVYQVAERLSDLVWHIVLNWDVHCRRTIGSQLTRAVDSIGANIAERCGRGSYNDNGRFVKIARGSLYETKHWLRRAYTRGLLDEVQINPLKELVDNLAPQLNAYLKSIGPKRLDAPNLRTTDH